MRPSAGSPIDYVLAFAPNDLKDDGKFHGLKVKLAEKHDGYSVQARRGYFAPRNEGEAAAEARRQAAFDAEAKEQERIREAMFSKNDSQQLAGRVGWKAIRQPKTECGSCLLSLTWMPKNFVSRRTGTLREYSDLCICHFRSAGQPGYGPAKKASPSECSALQLEGLKNDGVSVEMRFQLKPGTYRNTGGGYRFRRPPCDSSFDHCSRFPEQTNTTALSNIFGAINPGFGLRRTSPLDAIPHCSFQ